MAMDGMWVGISEAPMVLIFTVADLSWYREAFFSQPCFHAAWSARGLKDYSKI